MHRAGPESYLLTGSIGVVLFVLIGLFSLTSLVLGVKSKSTQRFFAAIATMAVLELPRFVVLIVERAYTSRAAYCFHILAGIFFFLAFSIVCRQWSGLLQLGSYFRVVYGYHSLVVISVSFALTDLVSVYKAADDYKNASKASDELTQVSIILKSMREDPTNFAIWTGNARIAAPAASSITRRCRIESSISRAMRFVGRR
jgi:hypothetical protein